MSFCRAGGSEGSAFARNGRCCAAAQDDRSPSSAACQALELTCRPSIPVGRHFET
jgi:hypothetical protein